MISNLRKMNIWKTMGKALLRVVIFLVVFMFLIIIFSSSNQYLSKNPIQQKRYELHNKFIHPQCFTQGLTFANGVLVQSCGLSGKSNLKKYSKDFNSTENIYKQNNEFFQGVTFFMNQLILLTYKNQLIILLDYNQNSTTYKQTKKISFSKQLWGITTDQDSLIYISNGSLTIHVLNRQLQKVDEIEIKDQSKNQMINELQYDSKNNLIYANKWYSNEIIAFDLSGNIKKVINLKQIVDSEKHPKKCLNGIAILDDRIFITGKYFKYLYQISIF